MWKLQRRVDVDTTDLSEAERRRVSEFLAQHGEDGATTLRWMDDEAFERLFRKACDGGGVGTFERAGGGCTKLSPAEQQAYGAAVGDADVGLGRFYEKIDEAGVSETTAERFVAQNGEAALRLSVEMDSEAFGRLVEMDADAQQAVVRAWRSDSMEVSTVDVERVVTRVDSLETGKRTKAIRLLEDSDKAGVKFVDEVSEETLDKALGVSIGDSRKWRAALAKNFAYSDAVTQGDIRHYVDDISDVETYAGSEIKNAEGLVDDLAENPNSASQFIGAKFEADRAVYYVEKTDASEVVVEPAKQVDFKLKKATGEEFIEVKNPTRELHERKISREFSDMNSKFENVVEKGLIDYNEENDRRILTLGSQRRGISNELGTTRDEIRKTLKDVVFYSEANIEKIRIVMPDGDIYTFDVENLD